MVMYSQRLTMHTSANSFPDTLVVVFFFVCVWLNTNHTSNDNTRSRDQGVRKNWYAEQPSVQFSLSYFDDPELIPR